MLLFCIAQHLQYRHTLSRLCSGVLYTLCSRVLVSVGTIVLYCFISSFSPLARANYMVLSIPQSTSYLLFLGHAHTPGLDLAKFCLDGIGLHLDVALTVHKYAIYKVCNHSNHVKGTGRNLICIHHSTQYHGECMLTFLFKA